MLHLRGIDITAGGDGHVDRSGSVRNFERRSGRKGKAATALPHQC